MLDLFALANLLKRQSELIGNVLMTEFVKIVDSLIFLKFKSFMRKK